MKKMSSLTRHVLSLPLDTNVRTKLICCGFSTVENFKDYLNPENLKTTVNITTKEAEDVIKVVTPYLSYKSLTPVPNTCGVFEGQMASNIRMESVAYSLRESLKTRHLTRNIVSFSSDVDRLLGGGFPMGKITEIAGEAGTGKTQFCFQLCVDVQIPTCLGGVEGQAVFLDVEGTFFPQRVAQITQAAVDHCNNIAELSENEECIEKMKRFTVDSVMSGIFLYRCRNSVQLLAATHRMKEFLIDHPKVKLLVVDSIAQCVRGDEDINTRTKVLVTLGRMLRDLAIQFGIAVVLTNQVSAQIDGDGASYNIPALGAIWSHIASVKLMLSKHDEKRYLYQYKSPQHQNGSTQYRVTSDGIRDESVSPVEAAESNSSQFIKSQSSSQDTPVPFYPITQGLATELLEDWSTQALTQGGTNPFPDDLVQIREETIPEKWLLLSQKQLKICYDSDTEEQDVQLGCHMSGTEEPQHGSIVHEKTDSQKENDYLTRSEIASSSEAQKNILINRKDSQKSRSWKAVQATVATMLFSDDPAKPPPKKRKITENNKFDPAENEEKDDLENQDLPDMLEDADDQDNVCKEQSPPSPVLRTNRRKSRR